ncbi:class I mannose-6-phosphate isomerase [Altererythrobacter fulvus]|uniref:class I mannose-6-phosphate isomerase n=1 Tax=Caenibius fulvus TaxID=2126012 RepID=UPI003015975A
MSASSRALPASERAAVTCLLPTRRVEKPWGREVLPPAFAAQPGRRVGEIWFEPPAGFDALLAKYIFTSDKLSVQVHPPGEAGKDECWLVLEAEPGAVLGIGFTGPVTAQDMRRGALDGSIEGMLAWHKVKPGDFVYIPAGTVHAIGAGISLVEVQQNRDCTYRFYDYGRPRELHLEDALKVARGQPHDPALRTDLPERGQVSLVRGPFFRLDRADGPVDAALAARYGDAPLLVLPLSEGICVTGEAAGCGQCALAPSLADVEIVEGARCLLAQPCTPGA